MIASILRVAGDGATALQWRGTGPPPYFGAFGYAFANAFFQASADFFIAL